MRNRARPQLLTIVLSDIARAKAKAEQRSESVSYSESPIHATSGQSERQLSEFIGISFRPDFRPKLCSGRENSAEEVQVVRSGQLVSSGHSVGMAAGKGGREGAGDRLLQRRERSLFADVLHFVRGLRANSASHQNHQKRGERSSDSNSLLTLSSDIRRLLFRRVVSTPGAQSESFCGSVLRDGRDLPLHFVAQSAQIRMGGPSRATHLSFAAVVPIGHFALSDRRFGRRTLRAVCGRESDQRPIGLLRDFRQRTPLFR